MVRRSLVTGLTNHQHHAVTAERSTGHTGTAVLATPSMIGLVEWCCLEATADHLDDGEFTVGIHVCMSHDAPVAVGEAIDINVVLTEIEGRKLLFDIAVDGPRGPVSRGTHRRAVVGSAG